MSDLMASGAAWLADQLSASASRSVAYYRGNNFGAISATIGSSQFQSQNASGVIETWESRDYIVKAGSLPFGDPRRHDRIVETLNGVSVTYEVSSPAGVPLWRWADAFRSSIRVHTIAVAESFGSQGTFLLRFWGAFASESITDQQIAASLSKDMGGTAAQTRTITADVDYLYVVLPTSFGTPTFSINGLTTTAWELEERTIAFTGQAARPYSIYRSTYPITGVAVVAVS